MIPLVRKYTILLILTLIAIHIIKEVILTINPDLLVEELSDNSTFRYGEGLLTKALEYGFNIVFVILISKDLKKEKLNSFPLLMITFLASFTGVIFFLLFMTYNKITKQKTQVV
jgi:hypothetical protein